MAIVVFTIVGTSLILFRRAVEERSIRWQLYRLRDELRELAFFDRRLVSAALFRTLDKSLTGQCAMLFDVSIWALIPVVLMDRRSRPDIEARQRTLEAELARTENTELERLYEASVRLMMRHLLWRHLFLTVAVAVTLVGLFPLVVCGRWASRRIMSGALKPLTSAGDSRVAATV